jgi:hypothetical protein
LYQHFYRTSSFPKFFLLLNDSRTGGYFEKADNTDIGCCPDICVGGTAYQAQALSGSPALVLADHSMSASKLIGMQVSDDKGASIGTVIDVLVKDAAAELNPRPIGTANVVMRPCQAAARGGSMTSALRPGTPRDRPWFPAPRQEQCEGRRTDADGSERAIRPRGIDHLQPAGHPHQALTQRCRVRTLGGKQLLTQVVRRVRQQSMCVHCDFSAARISSGSARWVKSELTQARAMMPSLLTKKVAGIGRNQVGLPLRRARSTPPRRSNPA